MTDTREGAGGWEVPKRPDGDGLKKEMIENNVTFRKATGAFDIYLDGNENIDVWLMAARNGFEIANLEIIDGPFDVKIRLDGKQMIRPSADAKEKHHR